ncbi:MAG TPA: calcium-binding protein, partial [Stellaceae bacterium]|nr:calcium-binding protein [Stellaceae bacterium]
MAIVINGTSGSDLIDKRGTSDDYIINAGAGNDTVYGGDGNDILNGGTGNDTLTGGAGNDIYYVDSAADVVIEAPGGGIDKVFASVNYTLQAGQEIELLAAIAGATGLVLTGNDLSNTIIGGAGNDTLNDGAGNDTLNGGAGDDTMAGGAGNDVYYVDSAADVVIEAPGGGTDKVFASVNYTLQAGQEIEVLAANAGAIGASGLVLTGNDLSNTIIGGAGNDTLNDGAGNDTLNGGAGDDTMAGGAGN